MSEVILLDGGLDTASSPLAAKRGGLRACQNYEVGAERGYRRIEGIEVYDGTINQEINNRLRITVSAIFAASALPLGTTSIRIPFDAASASAATVSLVSGVYTIDVTLSKTFTTYLDVKTFLVGGVLVAASVNPATYDAEYSLGTARPQSDVNTDARQPNRRPDLSRTQKIAGLFWRNDKLYAIVDCVKISVTELLITGSATISSHAPENGAYMYVVGNETPFGEVLFKDGDSFTYVPNSDEFLEVGDTITLGDAVVRYTIASFDNSDAAIIWVCDHGGDGGWSRVETNRIASYKQTDGCDAASFFEEYNRFAFNDTKTNDVVLSTIEVQTVEAEAAFWKDKDNVISDMDAGAFAEYGWDTAAISPGQYNYWAGLNTVSKPLKCKFDFTGIPRTSRIVGITLQVKKRKNTNIYSNLGNIFTPINEQIGTASVIYDNEISFSYTGFTSENKALSTNWPTTTNTFSYGGAADLWGSNVSLTDLLSDDFFVNITARNGLSTPTHKAFEISYIDITVHYISQSNEVYIYRADVLPGDGINRQVVIPHRTIQDGLVDLKTAKGQIVIEGLDKDVIEDGTYTGASNRGYVTAPGDQLRTAIDNGGSLIAVLDTADGPQYLPSSYLLANANKRWHATRASPYAQDNTDISIICNGVGPAHVWDDRNLLPIATKVDAQYEKPTFSAYWANYLVLGYDTGNITFSDTGNPLSYEGGAAGAISTDVSDKITGILSLKGEALGIFTENTIQALYGDSTTSLTQKTISPNSGAIAYTVCDMGVPVFTDFRGIGTVDAVQEYGDFQRGRWSYSIQNYLTPILQNESQFLGDPVKALCAFPVRNKNQYRLCFSNGTIVTMTLVGAGLEQQFTTQDIFTRDDLFVEPEYAVKIPMPFLATEHGVTSAGRDVIFCSLNTQYHNGYVYRCDQGNKFPSIFGGVTGSAIEAYIDVNYNHPVDRPSSTSRIDRLAVYGICKGYATLGLNQSVFYGDPGEYTTEFVAGDVNATADKPAKYFMSVVNSGCEARDISFRISSNELEASHTLQAIEVFQTIDGQRKDDKR